jgi:tRNA(Ile)-lysidine synthase
MGGTSGELSPDAALVAEVRAALRAIDEQARVVLAVSGGPDSVGLAHLVVAARPDLDVVIVHVRHGLRDDAADADAAMAHARRLGVPSRVVAVDVVGQSGGPEEAARLARLQALAGVAQELGARHVLTGHTADDQAETVLLNIARGSGLPGLAGMADERPLTDTVMVRHPLLALRRADVRAVASATGLPVVEDPTNADPGQRRARARSQLLPALAALTGDSADPVVSLTRLARHARRDTTALDDLAAAVFSTAIARWGPTVTLQAGVLDAQPRALATRLVRLLLGAAGASPHPPSEATVAAVLGLADGARADVPGPLIVSRGGGLLAAVDARRAALESRRGVGTVDVPELGLAVSAAAGGTVVLPPWAPARAASGVPVNPAARLTVRARQAGDRIVTAAGTQVVADAMVDAGVPRAARDLVPVIADDDGLLWVPGVAVRADAAGPGRLQLVSQQAK